MPSHFAADVAKTYKGRVSALVTFSGSEAHAPADMTETRAEVLASFSDGVATLAKLGLKGNPKGPADNKERAAADRLLSKTATGGDLLKRRGCDRETIEVWAFAR